MLRFTERVVQTALCNTTARLPANQSDGTTESGCADLVEADENCVGFQNRLAHTTAIEPKWPILCCSRRHSRIYSESLREFRPTDETVSQRAYLCWFHRMQKVAWGHCVLKSGVFGTVLELLKLLELPSESRR
jgi:hypothetical protein